MHDSFCPLWNPLWVLAIVTWWRHQMETFSMLLALCAGNSPVTCEFPSQRPVTRSLDVFSLFCTWINSWWFETPSHSSWCCCNIENDIWLVRYWFIHSDIHDVSCKKSKQWIVFKVKEFENISMPVMCILWRMDVIYRWYPAKRALPAMLTQDR